MLTLFRRIIFKTPYVKFLILAPAHDYNFINFFLFCLFREINQFGYTRVNIDDNVF